MLFMFYFHISLLYIYHFCIVNLKNLCFLLKILKFRFFFLISYFFHIIRCNAVNMLLMKKLMCYLAMASKTNRKSIASQSLVTWATSGGIGTQNFPWNSLIAEEVAALRYDEPMFLWGLPFCFVLFQLISLPLRGNVSG